MATDMTTIQIEKVPIPKHVQALSTPNPFDEHFKPVPVLDDKGQPTFVLSDDGKPTDVPATRIPTDAPDGEALRFTVPFNTDSEKKAVGVMERLARQAANDVDRSAKIIKTEVPVKDSKGKVTGMELSMTVYTKSKIRRPRKTTETPVVALTEADKATVTGENK